MNDTPDLPLPTPLPVDPAATLYARDEYVMMYHRKSKAGTVTPHRVQHIQTYTDVPSGLCFRIVCPDGGWIVPIGDLQKEQQWLDQEAMKDRTEFIAQFMPMVNKWNTGLVGKTELAKMYQTTATRLTTALKRADGFGLLIVPHTKSKTNEVPTVQGGDHAGQ